MDSLYEAFSPEGLLYALEVLLKIGLGVVLGGAVGSEREISGRPAGIRTHMLMCMGVVLFGEVSKAWGEGDPSRIAAQIVTGVGFLGAGSILRMGIEVRGLTTAASIWATAAIGMAVSAGGAFYIVAVASTILVILTLSMVSILEKRIAPGAQPRELTLSIADRNILLPLIERIEAVGGLVLAVRVIKSGPPTELRIEVRGFRERILDAVSGIEGVIGASWTE